MHTEHAPANKAMNIVTEAEIRERLAQIDKEHVALTEQVDQAPGDSQESKQGDDDATEFEATEQKLAGIRGKLEELNRERDELHRRLDTLRKSA